MTARHVTITGDLGSGKTTVAKMVAESLGAHFVSTGELQRKIASRLELSTLDTNLLAESDSTIDSEVDAYTRDLASTSATSIVFDSRMAWHFVPESLKVRIVVDPFVAIARITDRRSDAVEKYRTASEALEKVLERYRSEVRRFRARYSVDITRISSFDLTIDASELSPQAITELIVASFKSSAQDCTQAVWLSPRRLLPAFDLGPSAARNPQGNRCIDVVSSRPFFFAVTGRELLVETLDSGTPAVDVNVIGGGDDLAQPGSPDLELSHEIGQSEEIVAWERRFGLDYSSYRWWLRTATEASSSGSGA